MWEKVKMQRLRQAKEEAEHEIARYRSHLEDEYKKQISEVTSLLLQHFAAYVVTVIVLKRKEKKKRCRHSSMTR